MIMIMMIIIIIIIKIIIIITIIGTSVCYNNHSLTIVTQVVVMAQRRKIVHYKPEGSKFDSG